MSNSRQNGMLMLNDDDEDDGYSDGGDDECIQNMSGELCIKLLQMFSPSSALIEQAYDQKHSSHDHAPVCFFMTLD